MIYHGEGYQNLLLDIAVQLVQYQTVIWQFWAIPILLGRVFPSSSPDRQFRPLNPRLNHNFINTLLASSLQTRTCPTTVTTMSSFPGAQPASRLQSHLPWPKRSSCLKLRKRRTAFFDVIYADQKHSPSTPERKRLLLPTVRTFQNLSAPYVLRLKCAPSNCCDGDQRLTEFAPQLLEIRMASGTFPHADCFIAGEQDFKLVR